MGAHGTRPPQLAEDEDVDYTFIVNANDDLQTPAEAQACPGWPDWHTAVDRKVEPLKHLGTYELVQCPLDCKPIGCKMGLPSQVQCDWRGCQVQGTASRTRLRAEAGVNYVKTFTPIVWLETLRTLLASRPRHPCH